MPCVTSSADGGCFAPTVETAKDGSYPISRPLFMYTADQPTGAVEAYINWILSDVGQCIIVEKGYAPATSPTCTPSAM